jgi:hypothetical protein
MQYGTTLRNNQLDAIETTIGASPKLQIFSGAAPANCAAADSGTQLAEITLPADFMSAAAAGVKAKSGTWADFGAIAGVAGHFRIKDNSETVTHIQGTITATGGGGDMTLDNTNIAVGQNVTVVTFSIGAGNA